MSFISHHFHRRTEIFESRHRSLESTTEQGAQAGVRAAGRRRRRRRLRAAGTAGAGRRGTGRGDLALQPVRRVAHVVHIGQVSGGDEQSASAYAISRRAVDFDLVLRVARDYRE